MTTADEQFTEKDLADLDALLGSLLGAKADYDLDTPEGLADLNANTDMVVFPGTDGDLTVAPFHSQAATTAEFSIDGIRTRLTLGQAFALSETLLDLVKHSLNMDKRRGLLDQHGREDDLNFRDTTRAEYGL